MIRLDATTRKLQAVLAGAVTTNQIEILVSYSDKSATDYVGSTQVSTTNSTTAVDICDAPSSGVIRDIDCINVNNTDTASASLTIRYNNNGTLYILFKATLAVGDQATYTHGQGWKVIDSSGAVKSLSSDIVTLTGTQTLTNKTFTAPNSTGSWSHSGDAILSGTPASAGRGRLQVQQGGISGGAPQSSGSTDSNQFAAIGNVNVSLRLGLYSSGSVWIQPSLLSNYATNFDLIFCPNGGNTLHAGPSGGLGYGTGSGGTVTQLTSKATGVTLNKPTGQITMNNAALAAGTSVDFVMTNSLITSADTLICNVSAFTGYTAVCRYCAAGSAMIRVTNVTAGSLSEAVTINFSVIKGATS